MTLGAGKYDPADFHKGTRDGGDSMKHRTPKQQVLLACPQARLDFYESLRRAGQDCWFIRFGVQGQYLTMIAANPRAAWREAYDRLLDSFRRRRTKQGRA